MGRWGGGILGGGGGANEGELSESAGGTFGRLTRFTTAKSHWTAPTQKAHHFKKGWE